MNSMINNNHSSSCNSVVDPILSPATAAVEKLKFFSEREYSLRLLSEEDEDENDENDEIYNRSCHCSDIFKNAKYEGLMDEAFDMTTLARISESILIGQSIDANAITCRTSRPRPPPSNIKEFLSAMAKKRGHNVIVKKQRRLVRCIAWDSRLAQLDSSSSVKSRFTSEVVPSHSPSPEMQGFVF